MEYLYKKVKPVALVMAFFGVLGIGIVDCVEAEKIQRTVSGTVTDAENGESLPGVNVVVEGTSRGTATNEDGEYSLQVPGPGAVLVYSFVGYQTETVIVEDREVIDVSLELDLGRLDEVIVVGYGSVEKSDLTGSVERVRSEDFEGQSMTQLTDMLVGTVAGFNANQSTSAAGGASLEIRGPTSLTAGTEPLVVLDGVIYNGSLRDINPNDVATIDILKDASSAAIFGARAASGVVLITTSKGSVGKPTINFSTRLNSTRSTTDHYAIRGPENYVNFRQNYYRSVGTVFPDHYWNSPDNLPEGVTLQDWRNLNPNPLPDDTREFLSRLNFFPTEIEQYLAGETINWYDRTMPSGLQLESDISVSGGTDDARYYWSIGYVNNEGIIKGDQFGALRTRLNVDFQIVDWLNVGANTQYSSRDESAVVANLSGMQQTSPYARFYEADGTIKWYPGDYIGGQNPLINTLGQDRDRKLNTLFSSLYAELNLPYGIVHKVSFQPRLVSLRDYNYWSPETIIGGQNVSGGQAERRNFFEYEWMVDNLLKWQREFGIHNFDVTLLHNVEMRRNWNTDTQNNTFQPSPVLGYSGLQFGVNPSLGSEDTKVTGDAMMARLNYTLMDRYLFTASIRRDGYSAFGQENPRATFPAGAFAWIVSEEEFFDIDLINQLKMRLSWGVNGNRDIGAYSSLAQLGSNQYYDGSSVQQGVFTSTLANPGLRWEETESINVGMDIGLLDNRINVSLDYYDMTTKNLLVDRQLPRITGYSNITTNIGELGNKGFEMTVRTVNITSPDLNWSSELNFSLNRNEIISLFGDTGTFILAGQQYEGEVPDFTNEWFPGQAIDVVWDYDIEGIWQEEELADAQVFGDLRPGDIKARDLDNNGVYEALQDKRFIGHTQPRFRIGLRNQVDFWRNFSASVFLRAELGHIRPFPDAIHQHSTYDRRNTPPVPYWTKQNRSNDWPRTSLNAAPYGGGIMMYKPASYVRVQDVSLNYTLPTEITEKVQIQNLRVFGSVRNLYSFDNWPGWDPESGLDPMPRTFTVGLSMSL